jgi:hypothetical protein
MSDRHAAELTALLAAAGLEYRAVLQLDPDALSTILKQQGLKLGQQLKLRSLLHKVSTTNYPEVGLAASATASSLDRKPSDLDDLSAVHCESLLFELLSAYHEQHFVQALATLNSGPGSGVVAMGDHGAQIRVGPPEAGFARKLGALVMHVQAPIIAKYGLAPDASGVARMKSSVHRRMVEQIASGGAPRIQRLANEARAALGLTKLRDTTEYDGAEDMFAKQQATSTGGDPAAIDGSDGGGGDHLSTQGGEAALRKRVRDAFEAQKLSAKSHRHMMERLESRALSPLVARSLVLLAECGVPSASLAGAEAAGNVDSLSALPPADEFFARYVRPGRPCVLRQLLASAPGWTPFARFSDFEYLRTRCGHRRVLVKALGLVDKERRRVFVSDPELKLPLVDYLEMVEATERDGAHCPFYLGKVSLRSELPELNQDLEAAAHAWPLGPLAPCFGELIPQGVFTYFGVGRQVTATHFDPNENLLCCLSGSKRLWLYPPSDAEFLYPSPSSDGSRASAPPFQLHEELPQAVRGTFADVARTRGPVEVRLEAGDAFYLPVGWWHCVEGSHDRNMILNFWMRVHPAKRHEAGADAC